MTGSEVPDDVVVSVVLVGGGVISGDAEGAGRGVVVGDAEGAGAVTVASTVTTALRPFPPTAGLAAEPTTKTL